jgi:hypothetical protein
MTLIAALDKPDASLKPINNFLVCVRTPPFRRPKMLSTHNEPSQNIPPKDDLKASRKNTSFDIAPIFLLAIC